MVADDSFRTALREQEPLVANWLSLKDPTTAEITAHLGFDFAVLDHEHTDSSLETITSLIRGLETVDRDVGAIIRVSWNDQVEIKRLLDMGADGVLVPMIESVEEAEAAVEATKYPPDGVRGVAGGRGSNLGLDLMEYFEEANDATVTMAQIETQAGLDNVEEIAAVEGLDGLFIGPADLSASLGMFGEWNNDEFRAAVDRIVEAAHAADITVGTLATAEEQIEDRYEWGIDYLVAGTDTSALMAGGQAAIDTFNTVADR
ncbi:MAG: HpcH/HpaI aldolase/citrate lyase family protein [Halobacteriales archaeon]